MKQFIKLTSRIVPLPIENVDTDQIIPARFLKDTSKIGYKKYLFHDWRFEADGKPKADFVLNNPTYTGEVLLVGKNFGSGSSREHAAWAIADYGFRVVISSYFADIFKNNAMNNGVLPIVVSEAFLAELFESVGEDVSMTISIDLPNQEVKNNSTGRSESFEINPYKKECFLNGFDDIDYLLSKKDLIEEYEQKREF